MSMNGIDISNWQAGLDLKAVPCDFVICKATEGTWFVDKSCAGWVETALAMGKPVGVYHYANGGNAVSEADYFVNNCANWVGKVLWCLDWEGQGNPLFGSVGTARNWIRKFCDRVYERTGAQPIVYIQASQLADVQNIGKMSSLRTGKAICSRSATIRSNTPSVRKRKLTGVKAKP